MTDDLHTAELAAIREEVRRAMPEQKFHDAMPTLAMVRMLCDQYVAVRDALDATVEEAEFANLPLWEKRKVENEHDDQ